MVKVVCNVAMLRMTRPCGLYVDNTGSEGLEKLRDGVGSSYYGSFDVGQRQKLLDEHSGGISSSNSSSKSSKCGDAPRLKVCDGGKAKNGRRVAQLAVAMCKQSTRY